MEVTYINNDVVRMALFTSEGLNIPSGSFTQVVIKQKFKLHFMLMRLQTFSRDSRGWVTLVAVEPHCCGQQNLWSCLDHGVTSAA